MHQPWLTAIVWTAALLATAKSDAALSASDELDATIVAQLVLPPCRRASPEPEGGRYARPRALRWSVPCALVFTSPRGAMEWRHRRASPA